jgi:hypothetical protein
MKLFASLNYFLPLMIDSVADKVLYEPLELGIHDNNAKVRADTDKKFKEVIELKIRKIKQGEDQWVKTTRGNKEQKTVVVIIRCIFPQCNALKTCKPLQFLSYPIRNSNMFE